MKAEQTESVLPVEPQIKQGGKCSTPVPNDSFEIYKENAKKNHV